MTNIILVLNIIVAILILSYVIYKKSFMNIIIEAKKDISILTDIDDKKERITNFLLVGSILLTVLSAFISISIYQIFAALTILAGFYKLIITKSKTKKNWVFIALIMHALFVGLGTILYKITKFDKIFELIFYTFIILNYSNFNKSKIKPIVMKYLPYLSVMGGYVLSIYVLNKLSNGGKPIGFWGGFFVTGNLLSISIFSTFLIYKRNKNKVIKFLILSLNILFIFAIFKTGRRSLLLALIVCFFILGFYLAFIYNKSKKKKIAFVFLLLFTVISGLVFLNNSNYHRIIEIREFINNYQNYNNDQLYSKLDSLSSNRIEIIRISYLIVKKSLQNNDYSKLLTGWGINTLQANLQKYNIDSSISKYFHSYESFVFINEFMHGGIFACLFSLIYYILMIIFFFKIITKKSDNYLLAYPLLFNLIYRSFTFFHVPINGLFYLLYALISDES